MDGFSGKQGHRGLLPDSLDIESIPAAPDQVPEFPVGIRTALVADGQTVWISKRQKFVDKHGKSSFVRFYLLLYREMGE